jgi:hypothetical protein
MLLQVAAVVLVAWQEDPHNTAYLDLLPLFNHEAPLQVCGGVFGGLSVCGRWRERTCVWGGEQICGYYRHALL